MFKQNMHNKQRKHKVKAKPKRSKSIHDVMCMKYENKHTHITLYIGYMHSTYKFIPDEYFMTGFLVKEGERERPFLQGRM